MNTFFYFRHRIVLRAVTFFPQIQMIALCNSRAMGEASENSDIDLFIIAQKNNLWTARFIATVITTFLGIRRRNTHGLEKGSPEYIKKTKNMFCLSFFITEEHLNFDVIRLQPDDPYLDRWMYTLIPLVNKNATYEHFMKVNEIEVPVILELDSWIHHGWIPAFAGMTIQWFFSYLSFFEGIIKRIWLKKTLRTYEKLGKPWGVVISDTMLKFHDNDQRKMYQEEYSSNH